MVEKAGVIGTLLLYNTWAASSGTEMLVVSSATPLWPSHRKTCWPHSAERECTASANAICEGSSEVLHPHGALARMLSQTSLHNECPITATVVSYKLVTQPSTLLLLRSMSD